MVEPKVINFNVRGSYFSMRAVDLRQHPDSYFAHLLKDEWTKDPCATVPLDRDCVAFRYIYQFVFAGDLETKNHSELDLETLLLLKHEADFFNLPDLIKLCDERIELKIQTRSMPSAHSLCECCCVSENEDAPKDELVSALAPFRPPCVATTRIQDYTQDRTIRGSGQGLLDKVTNRDNIELLDNPPTHNCIRLNDNEGLHWGTLYRLQNSFTHWPFGQRKISVSDDYVVTLYNEGSHFTRQKHTPYYNKNGTLLSILNSPFTGGVVSCTINGKTVCISQPGECMALEPTVTYSVAPVITGVLVLVELDFSFVPRKKAEDTHSALPWTLHYRSEEVQSRDSIPTHVVSNLVSCIDNHLIEYDCVVIGLLHFYPIRYTLDEKRRFETDPDSLQGMDSVLYTLLLARYDVNVVTVYVDRLDQHQNIHSGCILDDTSIVNDDHDTAELEDHGHDRPQCKIVVPIHSHGIRFHYQTSTEEESTVVWGTVSSGLMLSKKNILS